MFRFRFARVFLLAAALVVPVLSIPHAASASVSRRADRDLSLVGPKKYYLALGDSLAFGYQPATFLSWNKGYANDWFNSTLKHRGTQTLVNLACIGESTTTFIHGECPVNIHKVPYKTDQLDTALSFIKSHPNQVSPVTIDIGGNDVLAGLTPSTCAVTNTEAISSIAATFDTNYKYILSRLKQALTVTVDGQPHMTGDLFTMNYFDPYQNRCAANPLAFQLFTTFNQHLEADAQEVGVPLADVFTAFGGAGNADNINPNITGSPDGSCPSKLRPSPTAYTWICTTFSPIPQANIHPTTLGYQHMTDALEAIARY